MAKYVLTLYDILNTQKDPDSIIQKKVLTQNNFINTKLAATSYWTSQHNINYLYFGGNSSSELVRPITYGYESTGYTDYSHDYPFNYTLSNWKRNTSGNSIESTSCGTTANLLYFPDYGDDRCLTTGERISLDYYVPYPSHYSTSIGLGWRLSTEAAGLYSYNPGSNWHVIAWFLIKNTPTISGWSYSGLSSPDLTSSNYSDTIKFLYGHPTCVGYFEQTHYGEPPSGKSVYNNINHHPHYKYNVISNSDYGFYMVPCSAQTGLGFIRFAVFTDIPPSSSRSVKLRWRYYGYYDSYSYSSTYNKLNYVDVPLTYIGENLYNNLWIQPSGYPSLAYIYTGDIIVYPDTWWTFVVGCSWMELCGLWY